MHSMICVTGVYSRDIIIINMFFISQVSGLVKNFNIGIDPESINIVNIKLCMMILLIELLLNGTTD